MRDSVLEFSEKIPVGYSVGVFEFKKYGITKTLFNNGNSFKIYAEELGGKDFISMNYYITRSAELLKPCEMSEKKVIEFLQKVTVLKANQT